MNVNATSTRPGPVHPDVPAGAVRQTAPTGESAGAAQAAPLLVTAPVGQAASRESRIAAAQASVEQAVKAVVKASHTAAAYRYKVEVAKAEAAAAQEEARVEAQGLAETGARGDTAIALRAREAEQNAEQAAAHLRGLEAQEVRTRQELERAAEALVRAKDAELVVEDREETAQSVPNRGISAILMNALNEANATIRALSERIRASPTAVSENSGTSTMPTNFYHRSPDNNTFMRTTHQGGHFDPDNPANVRFREIRNCVCAVAAAVVLVTYILCNHSTVSNKP